MKTVKKILCTMLVVVMCLTVAPLQGFVELEWPNLSGFFAPKASAAYENTHQNTGNQRYDIVEVAKTQLNYVEGSGNNNKYGAHYNKNYAPWCAYFVSWCAEMAGISDSIIHRQGVASPFSGYFNIPNSHGNKSYFPKTGDLVFYGPNSNGDHYHVGIVETVNSSTGYITTIEGNTNNNGSAEGTMVYRHTRHYQDSRICCYGIPNYQNNTTPSKPILSISDKNTSDKAVTFTWNKTTNTDHYDLRIYNHGNYNVSAPYYKFGMSVGTTSTTMKFPAGKYAAYITAVSSSGVATSSEWITTFDVVDPPGKSVLTATPREMITDGVTFSWTKAANAHTYDLRVYNYGDYNVGAPYYKFGMSSSTTSTTINLPAGKYAAYITTIASNGASEGGDSEWITFTVSEPAIDLNYPTNIKGYKMWIGATATQVYDTQTLNGYYLDDNEITLIAIYKNNWAKIKHTVDGTEKTAYIPLGGIICDKVQPHKMYLKNNSNIYSRYTCETTQSSQLKDKEVLVIGCYKTNLAQICYSINNTNYIGWIEKEQLVDHSSTNHTYTETITTQPTCTSTGIKTYRCSCGASYTESIEKESHIEVIDQAIPATCTSTGLTKDKHCSVCDEVIVAQKIIAALGHVDENGDNICDVCKSVLSSEPITPDTPTETCSCNCHKGGLAGFFFRLINFFQKLFGQNKVCACGASH